MSHSNLDRDPALGGAAATGATGAGVAYAHHRREHDTALSSTPGDPVIQGQLPPTGTEYRPTTEDSHLERDVAPGGATAAGPAAIYSQYRHEHDRPLGSTVADDPQRQFPLSGGTTTAAPTSDPGRHPSTGLAAHTAGPHHSTLANRTDPRVDSDRDGSRTLGSPGGASSTTPTTGLTHGHHNEIAALGEAGTLGAGLASHEHQTHHQSDATHSGPAAKSDHIGPSHVTGLPSEKDAFSDFSPGTDLRTHYHMTHENLLINRLDPTAHESQLSSSSGGGVIRSGTNDHDRHHHPGRDTAVGAGIGAVVGGGVAASSPRDPQDPSTGPASSTVGPHKSNLLNKLDPRVDSDLDGSRTFGSVPGTVGNFDKVVVGPGSASAGTGLTRDGHQVIGRESDYSRDPTTTRYSSVDTPAGTTSGTTESTGRDHHLGRDASLAGGVATAGVGAYEAGQRRPQGNTDTTTPGSHPSVGATSSTLSGITDPAQHGHHYGRDAALVGGTTAAGAEVSKHEAERSLPHDVPAVAEMNQSHRHETTKHHEKEKQDKHGGGGLLGFLHRDKNKDQQHHVTEKEREKEHGHYGAMATAAAGTGVAAVAGHEYHDRDRAQHGIDPGHLGQQSGTDGGGMVKEPYTGLPMNVSQYGSGVGGIDEGPQPGYHRYEEGTTYPQREQHGETRHKLTKDEGKEKTGGHGLLGFLHRDKDTNESGHGTNRHGQHHEAATGGAAVVGTGTAAVGEHERHQGSHHEHNKLHKDPPPKVVEEMRARNASLHDGATPMMTSSGAGAGAGPGAGGNAVMVDPQTGIPMDVGKYGTGPVPSGYDDRR